MADAFTDQYLTKDGETVAQARERLANEQKQRQEDNNLEMKG